MKSQVNPIVVIVVLAVVIGGVVFWFYKGGQGVNTGSGKMQSNLGPIEKDPDKLKKGLEDSIREDAARHGKTSP